VTCCPPKGYAKLFGRRAARRDVRRYEQDGLDDTGARMVAFLREHGVDGRTVLEIGGGVGALQLELLAAGAERTMNLELSPEYEESAHALLRERGLEDRADRRIGDVVAEPALAGPADAVLMHRVVCCYPDYDALVGAAAERTRRYLVMSFPRDRALFRTGARVSNAGFRLLRWDYRTFIHPPAAVLDAAERRGLRLAEESRGRIWHVAALERSA
jgi:magnesium-protoporphyrin O-methyltransferase